MRKIICQCPLCGFKIFVGINDIGNQIECSNCKSKLTPFVEFERVDCDDEYYGNNEKIIKSKIMDDFVFTIKGNESNLPECHEMFSGGSK